MGKENEEERIVRLKFDSSKFDKKTAAARRVLAFLDDELAQLGNTANETGKKVEGMYTQVGGSKGYDVVSTSIGALGKKFSALEVAAVTALVRITNKAIDMGKSVANSLSVDNISLGYESYEQNLNTIRGLMNVTGQTEDWLAEKTARIAWFNDETSYSYEVLASGIKNFMANGIADVDKATDIIEGIALASAKAGAPMTEFSHAVDILSRAYTQGYVDLQKWQSLIGSAGFATEEFKQQCIDAAKAAGTIDLTGKAKGVSEEITTKNIANYLTKEFGQNGIINRDAIEILLTQYASYANDVYDQIQNGVGISSVDEAEKVLSKNTKIMAEAYVSLVGKNADDFSEVVLPKAEDLSLSMRESLMEAALSLKKYATSEEGVIKRVTKDGRTLEYNVENIGNLMSEDADAAMILQEALKNNSRMQELFNAATEKAKETGEDFNTVLLDMAEDFQSVYEKAFRSGQEARTFADALNSAKNASKQGWSSTFNTIFGGLEGSVDFFTALANKMIEIALVSQETRDKLVDDWASNGGREALFGTSEENLGGVLALLDAIQQRLELMRDAFFEVFAGIDGKNLADISKSFQSWAQGLTMSDDKAEKFKKTIKGLLTPLKIIYSAFKSIWNIVVVPTFERLSEIFLDIGEGIGYAGEAIDGELQNFTLFDDILTAIMGVINSLIDLFGDAFKTITGQESIGAGIKWVGEQIAAAIRSMNEDINKSAEEGSGDGENKLASFFQSIFSLAKSIANILVSLTPIIASLMQYISTVITDALSILAPKEKAAEQKPEDSLLYKTIDLLKKSFEIIYPILNMLTDIFIKVTDDILDFINNKNSKELMKDAGWAGLFVVIVMLIKAFNHARSLTSTLVNGIKSFSRISAGLYKASSAVRLMAFAEVIQAFASGFAIILGALALLGKMDTKTLTFGISMFVIYIAAIITITVLISKLAKASDTFSQEVNRSGIFGPKSKKVLRQSSKNLVEYAAILIAFGASFALFGYGIKLIADVDKWWKYIPALISIGAFIGAFVLFVNKMKTIDKKAVSNIKKISKAFLTFAMAFIPIAAAVFIIGKLNDEEAMRGLVGVGVIFAGFMLLIKQAKKIDQKHMANLIKTAIAFSIFAVSAVVLASAVVILGKLEWYEALQGILGIAAIFGGFIALTIFAKKVDAATVIKTIVLALVFARLASACVIMGVAVVILGKIEWYEALQGILSVAALFGLFVMLSKFSDKINTEGLNKLIRSMIKISLAIGVFALSLIIFRAVDAVAAIWGLIGFIVAMIVVIGTMQAASKSINPDDINSMIKIVNSVSLAIAAFGIASFILSGVDWLNTMFGLISFYASLVTTVMIIKFTAKFFKKEYISKFSLLLLLFNAMMISLGLFAGVAAVLQTIDWSDATAGILAFALTIATCVAAAALAAKLLSGNNVGTGFKNLYGVIAAIILAMYAFSGAAAIMSVINWDQTKSGFEKFGLVIGIAVVALMALATISAKFPIIQKGLPIISAAVVALGVAMLTAGAGVYLFALSLEVLAAIGQDDNALAGVTNSLKAFIDLIPEAIKNIGYGLVLAFEELIKVLPLLFESIIGIVPQYIGILIKNILISIKDILPAFFDLLEEFLKQCLALIENIIDPLLHTVEVLLNALFDWLEGYTPTLATRIIELTLKLIDWLLNLIQQPEFADAIKKLFVKLLQTIIDLFLNLFGDFGKGIANWLDKKVFGKIDLGAAGKELGKQTMAGYEQGVAEFNLNKLKGSFDGIKELAADSLGIESPSKVFRQFGVYCMEGFANGITADIDKPVSAFQKAIDMSKDLVNDINDDPPTIRPVLDLSDIQNGMHELNGILPDQSAYSVDGSIGYTAQTASDMRPRTVKSAETPAAVETGTFNNVFNINGAQDPQAVAQEVSNIINKQIERRGAYRGRIAVKQ